MRRKGHWDHLLIDVEEQVVARRRLSFQHLKLTPSALSLPLEPLAEVVPLTVELCVAFLQFLLRLLDVKVDDLLEWQLELGLALEVFVSRLLDHFV